jgi:AcrR family transcriptional regulator
MTSEESTSKSERTRDQIIQAAFNLFLKQGYHGTSMREISKEAGIALGGIYNHFPNKEDIFLTVFLEHHPFYDILPAMQAAEGGTIEEFVRDAAMRMVSGVNNRLDFLNLMFIELVEFNGEHIPKIFQHIFPQVMEFADCFLYKTGEVRTIPPAVLVRAFIGLFFSYIMTDLIIGRQFPAESQENALEHFIDIFLHGILPER